MPWLVRVEGLALTERHRDKGQLWTEKYVGIKYTKGQKCTYTYHRTHIPGQELDQGWFEPLGPAWIWEDSSEYSRDRLSESRIRQLGAYMHALGAEALEKGQES